MQRPHGAYILARYSTDSQNPDSIEVQVDKCSEWCRTNRLPVLGVYADFAVSGMRDDRPQYRRMMEELRLGGADTVVVYDQSRMFRKMTAWFEFRDELASLGVSVASATQPMVGGDLRDPANFLAEGTTALFNQMWVLQTRQKVIAKMRYMARSAQHTGGTPPLGYCVKAGRLEIVPEEADVVRRIFGEYASGRSYREIIEGLNRDGIRTKRGGTFGSNSLHDLLRNPKYIGVLEYGHTCKRPDGKRNTHGSAPSDLIRVEGAVPAIVDHAIFEEVQRRMANNKRVQGGRPSERREYPLRGKVFCAECKTAMVVSISKGRYTYYSCGARHRLHTCDNMPIKVEDLESRVAEAVRTVLGEPSNSAALIRILREEAGAILAGAAGRLADLIARKSSVATQLGHAVDAILGGLDSPALRKKIEALEQEQAELERDMQVLRRQVDASAIPEDRLRELLATITASGDTAALLSVVARVEVSREDITVWTILDTDPGGKVHTDLTDAGISVPIIPGVAPPAPRVIITAAGALCIKFARA